MADRERELRARIADTEAELCRLNKAKAGMVRRASRAERERQAGMLATAGLAVEKRESTRFWNLLDRGGELVAVTVYRKGATAAGLAIAAARMASGDTRSLVAA